MSVITLAVNNTARGSVTGGGTYTDGQEITVAATNNSGYIFGYWSDGSKVMSSSATYTFKVSGDITLTAYFFRDIDNIRVYGLCEANCKHRVMTMGQIVNLIQEMASNDWQVSEDYLPVTAVNAIVEQRRQQPVKLFVGTRSEWEEWTGDKNDVLYIATDDTTLQGIQAKLEDLEEAIISLQEGLNSGSFKVARAAKAELTSFSTTIWKQKKASNITLLAGSTYHIRGNTCDFGLIYFGGTPTRSAVTTDGEYWYYLLITATGGVIVSYTKASEDMQWIEEDQDFALYYRRIT